MKDAFAGYYAPSEDDYKRLWEEGLIVLDTNVLLNAYRLPAAAREDLLSVLDLVKERLWIPHQVALEYQRKRLKVIAGQRKVTWSALEKAESLLEDTKRNIQTLDLDKRGLEISTEKLLEDLKVTRDKLVEALKKVHESQLDVGHSDPVRERLDVILAGKVGPAPTSQEDLTILMEAGDLRYENKIPPGYSDADKEKNPSEASFFYDGLKYERKFGDLILWRQILEYTKKSEKKSVMLVTSDQKEDWWWREKEMTVGPRPELVREIKTKGAVELFWMYSASQFLENAKKFAKAQVSEESVAELKEVVRGYQSSFGDKLRSNKIRSRAAPALFFSDRYRFEFERSETAVLQWLRALLGIEAQSTQQFPDFVFSIGERGLHGFEVKTSSRISLFSSDRMLDVKLGFTLGRGLREIEEGHLARFSLIIVVPKTSLDELSQEQVRTIQDRLEVFRSTYMASQIIVGVVDDDDNFVPVIMLGEFDDPRSSAGDHHLES
jgi:hypothetical protein